MKKVASRRTVDELKEKLEIGGSRIKISKPISDKSRGASYHHIIFLLLSLPNQSLKKENMISKMMSSSVGSGQSNKLDSTVHAMCYWAFYR